MLLTVTIWALGALLVILVLATAIAATVGAMVARKAEAAIPPAGRFTPVTGGRVHWVEAGQGPPIVMIHGLGGNLHNFTYALSGPLSQDFRVIALDRPGCGYSRREGDEQARIPEQARMIAEFLRTEGIEKPLIVGHSLGGAVALALAVDHPDRVGGLALISPLVDAPKAAPSAFSGLDVRNALLRRLIAHTIAVPMSIRNGARTLAVVFGPDAPPADFRTRGGGLLALRPKAFYATSTDFTASTRDMADMVPRYAGIACPVGMLYGTKDRILDAREQIGALQAVLPGFELETLDGRGHMPPIVEPQVTEAFIRRMAAKALAR